MFRQNKATMKRLIRILPALLLPILVGAGCTAQKAQLASEVYTIKDAYWSLVSLEGQDVQRPQDTKTAFIRFQENENDVHGFTGCNKFFGKYEEGGERLQLVNLSTTRMACPDMEQENKLMNVLRSVDSYRITDNILILYNKGTAVATFMTGTEQSIDNEVPEDIVPELDSVSIY